MTFQSPYYEQVLGYWKSLCTNNQIPTASMFDPIAVSASMQNITLWEMDENDTIRCRLAGTAVVERMSIDITGVELSEIMGPKARHVLVADFRTMLSHPCGVWYALINRHPTGKIVVVDSLILPLNAEPGKLPKFVMMHGQREILGYEIDEAKLELGRDFHEHAYIDLGWKIPPIQNETSA